MSQGTVVEAELNVGSGRLIIGDAFLPPRGVGFDGVPSGLWRLSARSERIATANLITSFSITFSSGGTAAKPVDISVDGGILAIATPRDDVAALGFLARRRERRHFEQQLKPLFRMTTPVLSLYSSAHDPWAIVAYTGDGIFAVETARLDDGMLSRISYDLHR
jgi:hypothetical protein